MTKVIRTGVALLIAATMLLVPNELGVAITKLQRDPAHDCCAHRAKTAIPDLLAPDCHCSITQSVPVEAPAKEGETAQLAVGHTLALPFADRMVASGVPAPLPQIRTPQFRYIAFHQLLI